MWWDIKTVALLQIVRSVPVRKFRKSVNRWRYRQK